MGRGRARTRLEAAKARGLPRFVGRERDMDALEQAREAALSGSAQVVGIVGEPGVGKRRLCCEFAERCRERGMPVYEAAGQAHARAVPLLPMLALLREYFGIGRLEDRDAIVRPQAPVELLQLGAEALR